MKKYRIGLDIWGLLVFLIIMIPNLIWFAVPAPNDIYRGDSTTETVDAIASVCRVLMVAALCFLRNVESKKLRISPFIIMAAGCCLLYFASWIAYYAGIVNAFVILGLTIPPCLVFLLFSIDRKNGIAIILTLAFTVCHLIYAAVNFLI